MKIFRTAKEKDIIVTAYNLFRNVGFLRVGVDRIVKESDIAKNTFYVYFEAKDNLLISCLEYEISITQESIHTLIAKNKINGSKACLAAIYDWHLDQHLTPNFSGNLMIKASVELIHLHEVRMILTEYNKWLFVIISSLLDDLGIKDIGMQQVLINLLTGLTLPTSVFLPTWEDIERFLNLHQINDFNSIPTI